MDIITAARELGKALQADEKFKKLEKAQEISEKDEELQSLIGEFNLKKMAVNEELSKSEKETDKIKELDRELKDLYEKVMTNPNMVAFTTAKQEMDAVVGNINTIIVGSLNGEDPDGIDLQATCTGSCSSCGGCH